MLLNLCKSCQYCLETMYWNCCEEKCCFDKKIATYQLEDESTNSKGYVNYGASFEVITDQPTNNNHLPQNAIVGRATNEMPVHADKIYEIFSKSMIFREEHELKPTEDSEDILDECETKSEPDYLYDKPNRSKVYFEDEINSPVTDFEIMFRDDLLSTHDMFKIEEEEESDKNSQSTEEGLVMNVAVKKHSVIKPSTVTIKDETKISTQNPIYAYDPQLTVTSMPSNLILPKNENVKGILRQTGISRSVSAKNLERADSAPKLIKTSFDNLKNIDPGKFNKVISRVPHRSASFLNIPEHLVPEKPQLTKSKSTLGVIMLGEEEPKISRLPDTPIIKSNNLPRFFAESPDLPEYKGETSLQSIKQQAEMLHQEDLSMPRYYGTLAKIIEPVPVHESKSMPDLRNPIATGKVSKRLVKLRSRLKPLVIKKGTDERV